MFCTQCNMLIHEGEVTWVKIYGDEIPFCPIHREDLIEIDENQIYKSMKNIFRNIKNLKELESSFTWENLIGDFGEYIGINEFNLKKVPRGTKGFDAITIDNKRVQIKAVKTGTQIKFHLEYEVELLLVLQIYDDASWEVIYYGSFEKAKELKNFSKYSNRYTINVNKLKDLHKEMGGNN